MVNFNTTVDDISPMIAWNGTWQSSDRLEDTKNAYGRTLRVTDQPGDSLSLQFYGTAITMYGSKRDSQSGFRVRIDNTAYLLSGFGNGSPDILFSADGLAPGLPHTITIINAPVNPERSWLGIDRFVIMSGREDVADTTEVFFDDVFDRITYDPPRNEWKQSDEHSGSYHSATIHSIKRNQSTIRMRLQGDVISLFGSVGEDFAPFSVSVDGVKREFEVQRTGFRSQVLLYHVEFVPGSVSEHDIELKSLSDGEFAFDYARALIYGQAQGQTVEALPQFPTTPVSSASRSGPSPGVIASIVIGTVAFLSIVFVALFLFIRRKKRNSTYVQGPPSTAMGSVDQRLPIYGEYASQRRDGQAPSPAPTGSAGGGGGKMSIDGSDPGFLAPSLQQQGKGYDAYMDRYRTGAVRYPYEPSLRPEDSASMRAFSPPP